MIKIQQYLEQIAHAIYGKDVRQSIINSIWQCYEDSKAVPVDDELSETSKYPVQNKVITKIINAILSKVKDLTIYITPEMYGAVGDGVTDDSEAIQTAIDKAGSSKVVYLADKKYKIGTGLKISSNYAIFKCDGWLNYSGEDSAVTLSNMYRGIIEIEAITATNGTALKLDATEGAVYSCDIKINFIRDSKVGIYLYTNYTHISHNTIRNTYLASTETGIKVWADNGSNAYINENLWYLDWICGGCQYGIHLHSDEALNNTYGYGVNDNKFYSASLEGMATENSAGIFIDKSNGNFFEKLRTGEGYGEYFVKFNGTCNRNDISLSQIYLDEIDISGLGSGSVHNVLRCLGINNDHINYFIVGDEVRVSGKHGLTYVPDRYNYEVSVESSTFTDNVIGMIGTAIPTSLTFRTEELNGSTFKISNIYSEHGSMTRAFPLVIRFVAGASHVKIVDSNGDTVIDNIRGAYDGKVMSIRWNGYHKGISKNIWSVQDSSGNFGEVDLSDLTEDIEFTKSKIGVVHVTEAGNKYKTVVRDDGLLTTSAVNEINQVPISTDADGNVYNDCGYQTGSRISSDGTVKNATNGTVTGFIPIKARNVVTFKSREFLLNWNVALTTNCIQYYDGSKNVLGSFTTLPAYYGICTADNSNVTSMSDGSYSFTVPEDLNIAYLRLSVYGPNGAVASDLIVNVEGEQELTPIVESVNGKTGKVKLTASDVGALPDSVTVPTKTSQLINDSGFLTQHQDISGKANKSDAETWTFTLSDGSTVTKKVVFA